MKKTRFSLVVLATAAIVWAGVTALADPVTPANVVLTCVRDAGTSAAISSTTFYQGDTLSLTNSIMYAGVDTNSAVQNLDGCTILVVAGQPGNTNTVSATGVIISTNAGTFSADFIVPAFNPTYVQVTVSNGALFTYPRYRVTTQAKIE